MSATRFPIEPNYIESIRGLLRLHEFELAGDSESPEADAVRDSLEKPWYLLSNADRKRITGLSGDLYSITEPIEAKPMTAESQRALGDVLDARREGRWDEALELLRKWRVYIEPALCSYLRGSVWMEAGDSAVAAVFFKHAAELEPDNPDYKSLYLHALHNADPNGADELARRILSDHDQLLLKLP